MHWTQLERAADALDALSGISTKASINAEIIQRERALTRELVEMSRPFDQAVADMARAADWRAHGTNHAIARIADGMRSAGLHVSRLVGPIVGHAFSEVFLESQARASSDLRTAKAGHAPVSVNDRSMASSIFDVVDDRVVDFARTSQGAFVSDEYGRRADEWSERARDIVASGIEAGLDSDAIAEEMEAELGALGLERSQFYWRAVSSIQVVRARSFGSLRAFSDAGIARFGYVAVDDEATCYICHFYDGKTFSVDNAIDKYRRSAEGAPEDVVTIQPFTRIGTDPSGSKFLFLDGEDGPLRIAEFDEPEGDGKPEYRNEAGEAAIEAAGCPVPPQHGLCRCTIEAMV